MSKSGIEVDFDGSFKKALKKLSEKHKMTSAQIVNQTLLDIAEKSFELTPYPKGVTALPPAPQKAIRDELRALVADVKLGRTAQTKEEGLAGRVGKKGQFIRKGKLKQLQAINLIANYWRGRKGKKGLYGDAMRRYVGKIVQSRTGGAGSLKIAFLPAMRGLMRFAKFKFSWSAKAKGIKRWPGSAGWGSANPAKPSISPEAIFTINRTPKRTDQDGKVLSIYRHAIDSAISWKRSKVIRQAEEMMRPAVDEFNR